jgi:protein SCO1
MKNYTKAGVLTIALVLPAFIFLFLHQCTDNHYKLPYYVPKMDTATGQITMKGKDTVFHTVPPFVLTDQNNQQVTEALTKNKIYVADFIFTRCATICPKITSQLVRIQKEFADDSVLILSHTIDPDYDTPEVLKGYATNNDAQDGVWYFLTGNKASLYDLAHKGYYIAATEDEKKTDAIQTFSHSDKLILIDKEGHIRGFYEGTNPSDVDRLRAEIKVLIEIYKQK